MHLPALRLIALALCLAALSGCVVAKTAVKVPVKAGKAVSRAVF